MVISNNEIEILTENQKLPNDIIYHCILNRFQVNKFKSLTFTTYENYLSKNGFHIFDYSLSGIELFSKFCDVIKNVIYWNIPEHFLFFPENPETLYFNRCKGVVNVNSFKNLKRLTIINTKFETLDLSLLPKLEYLRIEYFFEKYNNSDIFILNDYFFKNINKISIFVNINGRTFDNNQKCKTKKKN